MKPQVFTSTTSASSPSPRSVQPSAASRAASSSESTSLRAQPSVTRLTVRELDTRREYVIAQYPHASAPGLENPPLRAKRANSDGLNRNAAGARDLRAVRGVHVDGRWIGRVGRLVLAVHR